MNSYNTKMFKRAFKKVESIKGFYRHFTVYLLINIALLSVAAIKAQPGENFFTLCNFSLAIFWGIPIAFHAIGVFGNKGE